MENTSEIVGRLKDKLEQLISLYEQMRSNCNELEKENLRLNALLNGREEYILEIEEKNRKLQLAGAFKISSADAQDAKLKIGKIVREIDKCIALLNK
ncbi:MAG: hypothetical protein LBL90_01420 [Prevotellaceae bacterium]|nr:hypothetical protein [Prevotellaceae bacterium]